MEDIGWPAVKVISAAGQGPFVLLCDHASAFIPPELDDLGLSGAARMSHVAWDIGALDVARGLSAQLDAPLVAGALSRLVYDCNRPLEAPDCIPVRSEVHEVPGNRGLGEAARRARFRAVHQPFHAAADAVIEAQTARGTVTLVTVHTFTPVYHGQRRVLDIGYLFHSDGTLAEACVALEQDAGRYRAALNAPYDASDGVTYSLHKHADARRLTGVMVEIRNDLVDTPDKAMAMAGHLAGILADAVQAQYKPQGASA